MQYVVEGLPTVSLPDVCTNTSVPGRAFCADHCRYLEAQSPSVPTDLRGFLKHCNVQNGTLYNSEL